MKQHTRIARSLYNTRQYGAELSPHVARLLARAWAQRTPDLWDRIRQLATRARRPSKDLPAWRYDLRRVLRKRGLTAAEILDRLVLLGHPKSTSHTRDSHLRRVQREALALGYRLARGRPRLKAPTVEQAMIKALVKIERGTKSEGRSPSPDHGSLGETPVRPSAVVLQLPEGASLLLEQRKCDKSQRVGGQRPPEALPPFPLLS